MWSLLRQNKSLFVVAIIAIVNALGYGIIIPILYSYTQRFGLNDFQAAMLFAVFSLCAFLASPVIGTLSDKYGRKPMLLISLIGTAISFILLAIAHNPLLLFLARALDGITAGNIPVVQAVISDTTEPKDRAKGFGIIGASFGFGFVFGPAISAITVGISPALPFWIATCITLVAIILTYIMLPETNKHLGQMAHKKLFDFGKLAKALFDNRVGKTLLITLAYSTAFGLFIFSYQPVSVKQLHLSPTLISANFTIFGVVGLISQAILIPWFVKKFPEKKGLIVSLSATGVTFIGLYLGSFSAILFGIISVFMGLANSLINPMVNSILSREVDPQSQGEIMGINASYMSLGNIIGPVLGGVIVVAGLSLPFLLGGLVLFGCAVVANSIKLPKNPEHLH